MLKLNDLRWAPFNEYRKNLMTANLKTSAFLITLFLLICLLGCSTKRDISGTYSLKRFPKISIKLNSDSSFEYSLVHINPYLHPFDHPEVGFVSTKGKWKSAGKRMISLNSQKDSLTYTLAEISKTANSPDSVSNFVFVDEQNDPVKILYVAMSDSSIISLFHGSLESHSENLIKRDTLEFHFFGFKIFKFISGEKKNYNYTIKLRPTFRPGYFNDKLVKVSRNGLSYRTEKHKFHYLKARK
jgi:hypothetical protein